MEVFDKLWAKRCVLWVDYFLQSTTPGGYKETFYPAVTKLLLDSGVNVAEFYEYHISSRRYDDEEKRELVEECNAVLTILNVNPPIEVKIGQVYEGTLRLC